MVAWRSFTAGENSAFAIPLAVTRELNLGIEEEKKQPLSTMAFSAEKYTLSEYY